MRAGPRQSSRSQSEAGDTAVGIEEQYHSQNVVSGFNIILTKRLTPDDVLVKINLPGT